MPINVLYLISYVTRTYTACDTCRQATSLKALTTRMFSLLLCALSVFELLKLWQHSACFMKFSVLCESCFCECCISLICGVGYHGVFQLRETEDTLLLMAEEGNYEEFTCCLTKEEHKVTEVFRWYKESKTMARNPGSTRFFSCSFQRYPKKHSARSYNMRNTGLQEICNNRWEIAMPR